MLTSYIESALRRAHYELMENGRFWSEIPGLDGVWAEGDSLEKCRENLREVLEDWLIVGFRHGHTIPVLDGIDLNPRSEAGAVAD